MYEHYEGTSTCLECHEEEATSFFHSQHYQWQGQSPHITNADGEFIPFHKKQERKGLSKEAELQIDMWNKAMQRDFPTVDIAYIDMISTMCYLNGEDAKAYANKAMEEEDADEGADEGAERNTSFTELNSKYVRVHI